MGHIKGKCVLVHYTTIRLVSIKWKTIPKEKRKKYIKRGKIDTHSTDIHDRALSGLGRGTSIKSDGVKRVAWTNTSHCSEMMLSCKCFKHISNIPTLTYNRVKIFIITELYDLNQYLNHYLNISRFSIVVIIKLCILLSTW